MCMYQFGICNNFIKFNILHILNKSKVPWYLVFSQKPSRYCKKIIQKKPTRSCLPCCCKSRGASEPRRRGCSCSELPQTLFNTGSEVPRLSRRVKTWQVFCTFLDIIEGLIQKRNQITLNRWLSLCLTSLCHVFYATAGFIGSCGLLAVHLFE